MVGMRAILHRQEVIRILNDFSLVARNEIRRRQRLILLCFHLIQLFLFAFIWL